MIIQDKQVKELNDAKNALEEYVYDLRDKLCGIYEKYITGEVSDAFLLFCHNTLHPSTNTVTKFYVWPLLTGQ